MQNQKTRKQLVLDSIKVTESQSIRPNTISLGGFKNMTQIFNTAKHLFA
jgi:hypothetical protein